jgi:hypothetical protein
MDYKQSMVGNRNEKVKVGVWITFVVLEIPYLYIHLMMMMMEVCNICWIRKLIWCFDA